MSSCCLLGQSDGWLEVPHRGVTAHHMGGSGRSLSPVEVHTHGSYKQLKRPGRCHLCGYHSTSTDTCIHTHTCTHRCSQICTNITATLIQMIKLIVSYCLMVNEHVVFLFPKVLSCLPQACFEGILAFGHLENIGFNAHRKDKG